MRRAAPWVYGTLLIGELAFVVYGVVLLFTAPSVWAVLTIVLGSFFAWQFWSWWRKSL